MPSVQQNHMRYDPIDARLFGSNRERLKRLLLPNSLAVVNANDVLPSNGDGTLGICPNSDLFYLSGVEQEESILLLFPGADDDKDREILFLREPRPELETWEGHKLTKAEAKQLSGVRRIEWLDAFPRVFHKLLCECEHVYLNSNEHKRAIIEVENRDARFVLDVVRRYPLHDYRRLAPLLHQLRVTKTEPELALLRRACDITGAGFRRVLEFIKPGVTEFEIEAEFAHEFTRRGARFAYLPIIGGGPNSCVLHYIRNSATCLQDQLLLLDVGACYANYNADMTRTVPVSGRFNRRQRQVYEAVLRVLRRSIQGLRPGRKHKDWQKEGEQLIEQELVDLGLLTMRQIKRQDPDEPAFKKFFMHGLGHPLGLDVHDVGLLHQPIQAGWIMTVEPAVYIREENLAVRLENDVLVTEKGPVDLMKDIPIEAGEIEDIMNQRARSRTRPARVPLPSRFIPERIARVASNPSN